MLDSAFPILRSLNLFGGQTLTLSLAARIFIIPAAFLAVQSIASLWDGFRFLRFVRANRARKTQDFTPRAVLIIPVKGVCADFDLNLRAFLEQDYPDYQLTFAVASRKDPAFPLLAALIDRAEKARASTGRGARQAKLLVAGYSDERGEKVNNLLCGVASADASAEVLAFADADARPRPDWLRSLIAPLADSNVTVSTGFRWYLPGSGIASQLRAAWDTSNATLLGDRNGIFAWGGSMALRASDFRRMRVPERYWAHTVSDDYAVTQAVHDANGRIRFEPRCLLASCEESTFGEFLRWANRQIILTRVYATRLWRLGLAAHTLYCGTFLIGLTLLARPGAALELRLGVAATLGVILGFGIAKATIRTVAARELFPEEPDSLRIASRYWQLAPLVPWIMWLNFLVAGFTRRIEWSGTVYELRSASEVRVLGRETT